MTDPRIAVLTAMSRPDWHPVSEAHGMPWGEAEALLAAYDASRDAVPSAPAETDEERADREETERDHARGDHTHCGLTCEVELPSEHLRNFVIAKGYPGTKGALDELLRRARAEAAPPSVPADADLRDRIARVVRTVPIRLGPNALAMAQRGEPIILNMNEADAFAEALAPVLPEARLEPAPVVRAAEWRAAADAIDAAFTGPDLDRYTRYGADLLRRMADEAPQAEVVHGCPPDGSGLTPCCGRTPFELPVTDRISSEAPITCPSAVEERQADGAGKS